MEKTRIYHLADFAVAGGNGTSHEPHSSSIDLHPSAEPPAAKFAALLDADRKFKQTWNRQRADISDRSPSGWDMALANIAVEAGWGDQEIVNLLIASRRRWGDDLKLREDYYAGTIQKAHAANGNIDQRLAAASTDEDPRDIKLGYVSEMLGFAVHSLIRHPGPPASYRIKTELGEIPIRSIEGLTSATKFRNLVADGTRRVVPTMKPKIWDTVVQTILDVCEDDIIEDTTEGGRVREWLDTYITDSRLYSSADVGATMRKPFVSDAHSGRIAFFGDALHIWLVNKRAERIGKQEMSAMLRAAGCEQVKLNVTVDSKRTTRLVWLRPNPLPSAENYSC